MDALQPYKRKNERDFNWLFQLKEQHVCRLLYSNAIADRFGVVWREVVFENSY